MAREGHKTGRSRVAVVAHFRSSAGSMADRREERGGARNESRDAYHDVVDDLERDSAWADHEADHLHGHAPLTARHQASASL